MCLKFVFSGDISEQGWKLRWKKSENFKKEVFKNRTIITKWFRNVKNNNLLTMFSCK